MHTYWCPSCHTQHVIGKQLGGKLGLALAGGGAGALTRDPAKAILGAVVGIIVGHWIDENVLPRCPDCGAVLQLIDTTFL